MMFEYVPYFLTLMKDLTARYEIRYLVSWVPETMNTIKYNILQDLNLEQIIPIICPDAIVTGFESTTLGSEGSLPLSHQCSLFQCASMLQGDGHDRMLKYLTHPGVYTSHTPR